MKNLIAKYYKSDGQIVIYNESGKLIEFPVISRWEWGLPPISEWKQIDGGCEIEFSFEVAATPQAEVEG